MNRRGFLGSILALGAAPAVVRASSLMRIAAPAATPLTFSELIAKTIREKAPEIAENIRRRNALIALMQERIRNAERVFAAQMADSLWSNSDGGLLVPRGEPTEWLQVESRPIIIDLADRQRATA